jgi:hypothetical protein
VERSAGGHRAAGPLALPADEVPMKGTVAGYILAFCGLVLGFTMIYMSVR